MSSAPEDNPQTDMGTAFPPCGSARAPAENLVSGIVTHIHRKDVFCLDRFVVDDLGCGDELLQRVELLE